MAKTITVDSIIDAPIEKAWTMWTEPDHIIRWNFASDDWESPTAVNDVRAGGKFSIRMQSKETKEGFDFTGIYTNVVQNSLIEYTMDDGRKVSVKFEDIGGKTKITETFEMESTFSEEQQREGWQAILNNFKRYVEASEETGL